MSKYVAYAKVNQLPPIPATIKPLPSSEGELVQVDAIVVAGLNLVGDMGYICPTVSLISANEQTGDMSGWSLCLGDPNSLTDDRPYHFRTSTNEGVSTVRGTEIPNTMLYFQAEVAAELTGPDADPKKLDEVLAYVLPFINDNGPPPPTGKSFDELIAEVPTSSTELEAARLLKQQVLSILDQAKQELTENWDYWKLFDELNRRLHESTLSYAWKSNPSGPNYNPELGVVEVSIAGQLVSASIGLSKDKFVGPCAVVNIAPTA